MSESDALWGKIWEGLDELKDVYGDEMILIGGIACWLHADKKLNSSYIDLSHDGDFYISLTHMMEIREFYEVTKNKRLGKSEIKINDVSYYIYVEQENNLCVPFSEIISKSVDINGYKCASLSHLLALKMDAYIDRKNSVKGAKDRRDIARILILSGMERGSPSASDVKYLSDEAIVELKKIVSKNDVFMEITKGNSHEAKPLKKLAIDGFEGFKNAYAIGDDLSR